MVREIKFRAWDDRHSEMRYSDKHDGEFYINLKGAMYMYAVPKSEGYIGDTQYFKTYKLMQYTGLKDKNNDEWYLNDIGEFDNGDRFTIECEDWLELFVKWIGEPECEDQARNFYRIGKAKKIGNIYENPELLET